MIPLGDIYLQEELRSDAESRPVGLTRQRRSARRVYSARVGGRESKMTVAMYQGDGAEEVCLEVC